MSSQVLLCTTNIDLPSKSFKDDWDGGDNQIPIAEVTNGLPALLWLAMFKGIQWANVIDAEQYGEALEDDEDAEEIDYSFGVPFTEKEIAIGNLLESEPHLSKYFEANGGVRKIVYELASILRNTDEKYVFINTEGASFNYNEPEHKKIVDTVIRICGGENDIPKKEIARPFGLALEKNGPVLFTSASDLYNEKYAYDEILEPNLILLSGISLEYANKI